MKTSHTYLGLFLFATIAAYATIVLAGAPLKGIDVKLGRTDGGETYTATTDADGKFTISNIHAGTYNIYCSYAACARAINTKGTGAVAKGVQPKFSIDIDGATGLTLPTARESSASTVSEVVVSGKRVYRAEITQTWTLATPGYSMTVSGKSKDMTGHVTLIR